VATNTPQGFDDNFKQTESKATSTTYRTVDSATNTRPDFTIRPYFRYGGNYDISEFICRDTSSAPPHTSVSSPSASSATSPRTSLSSCCSSRSSGALSEPRPDKEDANPLDEVFGVLVRLGGEAQIETLLDRCRIPRRIGKEVLLNWEAARIIRLENARCAFTDVARAALRRQHLSVGRKAGAGRRWAS